MKREIDEPSGQFTTGHEWDGIKELSTPVPKSISLWLMLSIAVAVIMWLLYPTWPYVSGYTRGLLGYSSRVDVTEQIAQGQTMRAEAFAAIKDADIATLAQDPTLKDRYSDTFGVLFRDNCAACHGRDLTGQPSFPNLTDAHWLWSGTPEEIEYTLQHGINHSSDDTRYAEMPAFGRNEMLPKDDINDVVEYVLSLSQADHDPAAAERGTEIFADNCSSCHNDEGIGGMENGAPDLTDAAWLYGGGREDLHETLKYGRAGVMPGWSERLSPEEIKMLTLYVLWAGDDDRQD